MENANNGKRVSFVISGALRLKQRPGIVVFITLIGLIFLLWGMAIPLSYAPDPIGKAAQQFAEGTRITVWLTLIAGFFGTLIGVLAGIGKLSSFRVIRWICDSYVWLIRGTPLLLQILFFWSVLPLMLPEGWIIPDFLTAALALAINAGAYNAECVRAGILSVPHGQIEAANALGLKPMQTFIDITLPQSMRVALPALANNLASLIKDSSLAYAISVVELTMVGSRVSSSSFEPVPVFITSASIYLILTTAFTSLTSALETRLDVGRKR